MKFVEGFGLVKDMWTILLNVIKGISLNRNVLLRCFGQSVHNRLLISFVPHCLVSHRSECELIHMETMVWMASTRWALTILICVVSLFGEEFGFIVRCNICSIIYAMHASVFSPFYDTLALQKGSIHKGT